ncbi:MAG: helix-turn-helix domain-containing protein [Xanthobacteraceae bacterium]
MTSLTISEFCAAQKISRAYFYLMMKAGKAPRSYKLGKTTRISEDAVREWIAAREAESMGVAA